MDRVAYYSTSNTGANMTVTAPEGTIRFQRVDPHGVMVTIDGVNYSISAQALPYVGRYFLAAAAMLGVNVNDNWGDMQSGGESRG
jgi:hypothetical protein